MGGVWFSGLLRVPCENDPSLWFQQLVLPRLPTQRVVLPRLPTQRG